MLANGFGDPVLAGGDACGQLLREIDWSRNPLGPPTTWPKELRTLVSVMLGSNQPVLIVWGRELTTLYNDGYAAMCGKRHPAALGKPFSDLWYEIWDSVKPILADAYQGIGTRMDDIQFTMLRNGYPEETHFSFSYTPVRDEAGAVLGMFCVCAETTEQVMLRRHAEFERERLRLMFEQAPAAIAMLEGPDYVFTFANPSFEKLMGYRSVVGKPVLDVVPEVESQGFLAMLNQVYETGNPHVGSGVPYAIGEASDPAPRPGFVDYVYQPLRGAHGKVTGIFVQAQDVTDRVEARASQELRNRELGHRLKNQLAVVMAIVSQTLRSASDSAEASERINGRLVALSKAHDVLLKASDAAAAVAEIVGGVLSLHDTGEGCRFDAGGPPMIIAPRPAMSLSLILHELATNAVKYGALANDSGRVAIRWNIERDTGGDCFVLTWGETGGPAVGNSGKPGIGSRLIRAGLQGTIRNEVVVDFHPDGLFCSIRADAASITPDPQT